MYGKEWLRKRKYWMTYAQNVELDSSPKPQLELPEVQYVPLYWMIDPRPRPVFARQLCAVVFKLEEFTAISLAMTTSETVVRLEDEMERVLLASRKRETFKMLSASVSPVTSISVILLLTEMMSMLL